MKLEDVEKAAQKSVPFYEDKRDVTFFTRQRGRLPAQREGDELDYRGLLHRDGSVLTALSAADLKDFSSMGSFGTSTLFRALGCKLLQSPDGTVPIKDVATSDTLLLREPPAEDAVEARLPLTLTLTLPLPLTGAEDAVEARNRLASAPALALILA